MASSNCSLPSPPIFSGENYQIWAVKMKTYLSAFDLWKVVENEKEPPQLPVNPTVTQMKNYSEEKVKRYKAKSCIESSVFDDIFIRIMTCETVKQAWDVLKEEFQSSDKTRQMQVLNLRREFEVLKMKESENLKEYNDRLMKIVNKIRLLGEELSDKRIVEKVLVSSPESLRAKKGYQTRGFNRRCFYSQRERQDANRKQRQKIRRSKKPRLLIWRNITGTDLTYNVGTVSSLVTWRRTSSSAWLIDSGCTHHMASDINIFKELDKTCTSKVRIDQNLLSVGQLLENNYSLVFKDKACIIHDPTGHELFTVNMKRKYFSLNWHEANSSVYVTSHDESSLWHKRMGHFNYNALNFMHKNDLVLNMPTVEVNAGVCEVCQLGKQSKLPFVINKAWRATEKLQLVHTDIYFMKQKSEVANVFWKFKAWIENQSGCKIKIIRSDNGTKYTSDRFNEFCEVAGIEHQLTATYTPQQNGVSERKNRTIMEMARCMLFEKNLSKKFWAETVNTSVYLLNRLPTKALKGNTPFEA
ncbi:uncharacterized protein LOC111276161 [Durio zibethinus]|uniref:Uncharacterized protein LOC111276161 n=1 Tax=Durio zibethinus TaxID=66656 RepID=A0A6P5WNW1_DURZI|nr:uncharacterized protein LOC111276161 [Durio zibethinus]